MTPEYRFRRHFRIQENGCWIWKGAKNRDGYGRFNFDGKKIVNASRFSMYLYGGFDLNSEMKVLHKVECNNPACVNPDHLYIGDHTDNMRDIVKAGNHNHAMKTHCPQGHEYTLGNTYYNKGSRICRICMMKHSQKYRDKLKARLSKGVTLE